MTEKPASHDQEAVRLITDETDRLQHNIWLVRGTQWSDYERYEIALTIEGVLAGTSKLRSETRRAISQDWLDRDLVIAALHQVFTKMTFSLEELDTIKQATHKGWEGEDNRRMNQEMEDGSNSD